MNNLLFDKYNRIHNYLRISLTDSCNFRCTYCMPDENIQCLPHKQLMQVDEIHQIAKEFVNHGVNKIRLTGGEPLVRHDFDKIVQNLATLPVELAVTTNGVLLDKYLDLFKKVGLRSVNISLDTLDPVKFRELTKRDSFQKVWDNINLFIKEGFHIKLNVVAMRGVNEEELIHFIELTEKLPVHIRFIEFMPFEGNDWGKEKVLPTSEMTDSIKKHFLITKIKDQVHDTSKKYYIRGYKGTFAFITTMSDPFCGDCNRMRLTADGKMKNCLFGKDELDILGYFREGKDIVPVIRKCLLLKKEKMGGQFDNYKQLDPLILENRSMIKIGG